MFGTGRARVVSRSVVRGVPNAMRGWVVDARRAGDVPQHVTASRQALRQVVLGELAQLLNWKIAGQSLPALLAHRMPHEGMRWKRSTCSGGRGGGGDQSPPER